MILSFLSPEATKLSIVNLTYFKCISFFCFNSLFLVDRLPEFGKESLSNPFVHFHVVLEKRLWVNQELRENKQSVVSWYLLVFKFTGEPKSGLHSFFILIRLYNSGVSNVAAKKKLGKIVLRIFAFKFSNSCLHMKK